MGIKIVCYSVLAVLIIAAMAITSFIVGSILGFDTIGVRGLTAGGGLYVFYNRSLIFNWIDRRFK